MEKIENTTIQAYLKFYINMPQSPNYAVFINGRWGSGKTWFIEGFRDAHKVTHKFLYVSLYGVSTVQEIEDQIFRQLHPVLSSKPFTIGSKILQGAIKGVLKIDINGDKKDDATVNLNIPGIDAQKFLSDSENCILIFDDLERCEKVPDMLGYINQFVEHQGQKVILIGNEEELPKLQDYKRKNEKLVGRSFTLVGDLEGAFESFLTLLTDAEVVKVLQKNSGTIFDVFRKSDCDNLRTLRHSILEYERFFSMMPGEAKKHDAFQVACINAFFALAMELKLGSIVPEGIRGMAEKHVSYIARAAKKESGCPIAKVFETHFDLSAHRIAPNDESLYHFFKYGFTPNSVMKDAIQTSSYFVENDTPTWAKLWHLYDLKDDEFDQYFTEVLAHFRAHKFTEQGVFRHVVGLLLEIAKKQMSNFRYGEVVKLIHRVTNEMTEQNLFELLTGEQENRGPDDSYRGLGFSAKDDKCFVQLSKTLIEYQKRRKHEEIEKEAPGLLTVMKSNAQEFSEMLSGSGKYEVRKLPVLKYTEPESFVTTLIEVDPCGGARFGIGRAIKRRYEFLSVYPELREELKWLKAVDVQIRKKVNTLKQPSKMHLMTIRSFAILPSIKLIEDSAGDRVDARVVGSFKKKHRSSRKKQ